jgi:hypothetical protein
MHAGQSPHNLEVTEFLGADIHEHIFAVRIITVESLNGILHRRRKLSVGPSELLQ